MTKHFAFLALATAAVAACEQNRSITNPAAASASSLEAQRNSDGSGGSDGPGAVYTLTNQVAGNAVAVFTRGADGRLTAAGTVATGGAGTGASLGSQSAVSLSHYGPPPVAVNARSNRVAGVAGSP